MTRQVFVDETKQQGYVVAAAAVVSGDVEPLRRVVRGLVLPGQRRLHMKTERDSRRREIVAVLVTAQVEVVIYNAGRRYPTDREARGQCLRGVVADAAAEAGETRLVLEQDDSLLRWDSQRLIEFARGTGCGPTTSGPRRSYCWRCPTRSRGAGRAAGSGVGVLSRLSAWSATCEPVRGLGMREARVTGGCGAHPHHRTLRPHRRSPNGPTRRRKHEHHPSANLTAPQHYCG